MHEIGITILNQLGGHRFIAMTGSKDIINLDDIGGIKMTLRRNASKANRLQIKYNKGGDDYTMIFTKYTPHKYNAKTGTFRNEKIETIEEFDGVYADQLQDIFTKVTGMYTTM